MRTNNRIDIVEEIKSRCNIVDVVGRVVPLKKAGSNYKGICPFHNEKTPSFVVSESKQIFTCFGCGATGDLLEFVQRYYNLDFRGAVEMLAKEYGISLEGAFRHNGDNDEFYEINRMAAMFFFKALRRQGNPGYAYMKNREISEETLNSFGIGYADDSWDSLRSFLKGEGVSDEKMLELGLISRSEKGKYYDKFRGRVIFPIINTRKKVIGFGGRIIGDGEPKYLNSQESNVFKKKYNLYGLNLTGSEVRKEDAIILVEGYMDVVSLYQSGVRNVSASLGTALTEDQVKLIKRYTKNVILSYDADEAGQKAAMRGLDILYDEGCAAKVLKVTDGKDPDEFVKKNGRKAFAELVEKALPYGDFKLDYIKKDYDISDSRQRLGYVEDAITMLKRMKPVEADIYIKKLAEETGVSERAIRLEYSTGSTPERTPARGGAMDREGRRGGIERIPLVEQDLIKLMLTDASFVKLPEDIRETAFTSYRGKNIYDSILSACDGTTVDRNRVREKLDDEDAAALDDIERKIVPSGKEDGIFNDCIAKIRHERLKEKEKELMLRLSMADEDENHREIEDMMRQLMEIQRELKD